MIRPRRLHLILWTLTISQTLRKQCYPKNATLCTHFFNLFTDSSVFCSESSKAYPDLSCIFLDTGIQYFMGFSRLHTREDPARNNHQLRRSPACMPFFQGKNVLERSTFFLNEFALILRTLFPSFSPPAKKKKSTQKPPLINSPNPAQPHPSKPNPLPHNPKPLYLKPHPPLPHPHHPETPPKPPTASKLNLHLPFSKSKIPNLTTHAADLISNQTGV